jgi:hypothetical protein
VLASREDGKSRGRRGYLEAQAAGDSGVVGTVEARTPSFASAFGPWLDELKLIAFFDGGRLSIRDRLPEQQWVFLLFGTGGGVRARALGIISGALDVGVPLRSEGTTSRYLPRIPHNGVLGPVLNSDRLSTTSFTSPPCSGDAWASVIIRSAGGAQVELPIQVPNCPNSCKELKAALPSLADGVFGIDPDGGAGSRLPFPAFCDMTTDGGGWTYLGHWDRMTTNARLFDQTAGAYDPARAALANGLLVVRHDAQDPNFNRGPGPCYAYQPFDYRAAIRRRLDFGSLGLHRDDLGSARWSRTAVVDPARRAGRLRRGGARRQRGLGSRSIRLCPLKWSVGLRASRRGSSPPL